MRFILKDSAYAESIGSRLLMTVYKGIAPGGDRKALPSLDINTKRVADGLLQLAFSLSQQVGQVLNKRFSVDKRLLSCRCLIGDLIVLIEFVQLFVRYFPNRAGFTLVSMGIFSPLFLATLFAGI